MSTAPAIPAVPRLSPRSSQPSTAVVSTGGVAVEGARCATVPQDVMASVSPMKTPQGVMFTVRLPSLTPPEILSPGRYVALDGVQDPAFDFIRQDVDRIGAQYRAKCETNRRHRLILISD